MSQSNMRTVFVYELVGMVFIIFPAAHSKQQLGRQCPKTERNSSKTLLQRLV